MEKEGKKGKKEEKEEGKKVKKGEKEEGKKKKERQTGSSVKKNLWDALSFFIPAEETVVQPVEVSQQNCAPLPPLSEGELFEDKDATCAHDDVSCVMHFFKGLVIPDKRFFVIMFKNFKS